MKEEFDQTVVRLNMETARIAWDELERHFARGLLLTVSPSLDIVEVGAWMIHDEKSTIDDWLKTGKLKKTSDAEALVWKEAEAMLWAVVIAPWVLVQDKQTQAVD